MRKMDRMLEILKSHIDDIVAQWKEKEMEYQLNVEDLSKENDRLRVAVMELEQELEFATKRMDELVLKNTNLMIDLDEKSKPVESSKKWFQLFYRLS